MFMTLLLEATESTCFSILEWADELIAILKAYLHAAMRLVGEKFAQNRSTVRVIKHPDSFKEPTIFIHVAIVFTAFFNL